MSLGVIAAQESIFAAGLAKVLAIIASMTGGQPREFQVGIAHSNRCIMLHHFCDPFPAVPHYELVF